ncbi:MAG: tetratricopeptide repeat protein [Nodosilinea sp. WJT8-NPBG4]|jgi:tetratricopeptide (TPR) repeat protein|nr:tetratricopeptide repeat protein [Nodosilinea sp. WJT8-NPBG4]
MNTPPSKDSDSKTPASEAIVEQVKLLTRKGRALAKSGEIEAAIEQFECALQLDNKNIITINSYAHALWKAQNVEGAIQLFEHSLQINSRNTYTLNGLANLLAKQEEIDNAVQIFEYSICLDPNDMVSLGMFADLLVKEGHRKRAIEIFDRLLELGYSQVRGLTRFANLLAQNGEIDRAIEVSEHALKLHKKNALASSSLADLLIRKGDLDKGIQLIEYSLELQPNDVIFLTKSANLLMQINHVNRAICLFERALKIDRNDVKTLNCFANALAQNGDFDYAIQLLERLLKIEPSNPVTVSKLAGLLDQKGNIDRALQLFELALNIDGNNTLVLNKFADCLSRNGDIDRATQLLEHSLVLDKNNVFTLNRVASLMIQKGELFRAVQLLQHSLELDDNNVITIGSHSYARLQYAKQLEGLQQYEDALAQLLAIPLSSQVPYHANIVRLHLGRLYYLLNQPERGKQYIEDAIANSENSEDKDKSRLYAARSLLASNASSEEAIELLQQIEESSLRYSEAMKALALNADSQTAYELFSGRDESFGSTEMLYRAMYHKIGNEVAILKSIAYRLLRKIEADHPIVSEIIGELEELQGSVNRQRVAQKAAIAKIPHDNYHKLIEIVSRTAHDIADEVNNILATIESKTRRTLRRLSIDSPLKENFEKFLAQLELTQTALNDLKSINEGMVIRRHRFPIKKLFEKWEPANWSSRPRLQKARISFKLENSEAEFDGDEEKIKSIINELVENSLKHNHRHTDLSIWMYAGELLNPADIGMPTVPGNRRYLYIQICDNGKGISQDKKEWIFQPLNSTSPEEKGSGLGLFIARKTLLKMGGYIRETGEPGKGAKFQIYIPYPNDEKA